MCGVFVLCSCATCLRCNPTLTSYFWVWHWQTLRRGVSCCYIHAVMLHCVMLWHTRGHVVTYTRLYTRGHVVEYTRLDTRGHVDEYTRSCCTACQSVAANYTHPYIYVYLHTYLQTDDRGWTPDRLWWCSGSLGWGLCKHLQTPPKRCCRSMQVHWGQCRSQKAARKLCKQRTTHDITRGVIHPFEVTRLLTYWIVTDPWLHFKTPIQTPIVLPSAFAHNTGQQEMMSDMQAIKHVATKNIWVVRRGVWHKAKLYMFLNAQSIFQ